MARVGMDAVLVRSHADEMDRVAQQLHALVGAINGNVSRMHGAWLGDDAEQLVHVWQRRSRPALETVAGHVHRLAATARREAHDQGVTSGSLAGPVSGGGPADGATFSSLGILGPLAAGGGGLLWLAGGAQLALQFAKVPVSGIRATPLNLAIMNRAVNAAHFGKFGRVLFGASAGVGAFVNGANIGYDLATGRNPTGHVVGTVVDLVATKNIYVATGKATYDVTNWVLTETGPGRQFVDTQNEMALSVGREAVGGNASSPAAAADLVKRYEGISGFGHYLHDSGVSLGRGAKDMATSTGGAIGSAWRNMWSR